MMTAVTIMMTVVPTIMTTVVRIVMMMVVMVKIVQDEKTGKEKTGAPEWIGDPPVQIGIIPRRRIVSNDRRTFLAVIVFNFRRGKIVTAGRRR